MSQVSCIIPFYSGGDTVARAIDSVIYHPYCLEVVVVVDASPQPLSPSLSPALRKLVEDGKLRIVELATNHGQACARNIGVSVSTGSLLSFLDQDDLYLPGFYALSVPFMQSHPKLAALEVGIEIVQDGRVVLSDADPRYALAVHSAPWNVLVRRNAFWACGGFPVESAFRTRIAGEDIVFKNALKQWFHVASASDKLIRHHVREGSATDQYLKRTEVVDGQVVFKTQQDNEADGSWDQAAQVHLQRAWSALEAYRAVGEGPLIGAP